MSPLYPTAFFEGQITGSVSSAEVVVPLVLSEFRVRSVVDFGCGVGGWLKAFENNGITDYLGIDGEYVSRHQLRIPDNRFSPQDLTAPKKLGRRFDLACSLEVAEHLPASCAEQFVSALVEAAPVILFSAAVPGQGGTNHVNEQWQSHWANLFQKNGYVAIDYIRPKIFYDNRVEYWYRQNILIFCNPDYCPKHLSPTINRYELDRIHPELLIAIKSGPQTGRAALNQIFRDTRVLINAFLRKARLMPSPSAQKLN